MKRLALSLVSFTAACLALVICLDCPVQAQVPQPVSIRFENKTPLPLIIQGVSLVGGTVRKGQAIFIPPNRGAMDINVPPGPRQYKILDGNQPSKVLLPSYTMKVDNRDLSFAIVLNKTGQIFIVPDLGP